MPSRIETVRQFQQLRQEGKDDAALELLTDDASVSMGRLGMLKGKETIKGIWQMARTRRGMGFQTPQMDWSEPTEEGDKVKMTASTSRMGPVIMVFSFRGDKICKVELKRGSGLFTTLRRFFTS